MRRTPLILTAIALLVGVAALGFLLWGRHHHPHHPGFGRRSPEAALERAVKQLGLEPATSERVRAILAAGREQQRDVRGQLDAAFADMGKLLDQDSPDESAVLAQAERIGALRIEADKARLRSLLEVRARLTPQERVQLREKMQERPGRRGRFGRRGAAHDGAGPPLPAPDDPDGPPPER